MFFVYFLRSLSHPEQIYVGFTKDVEARFKVHNVDGDRHTAKYKPWELRSYVAFPDEDSARAFEWYCKGGAGRALARKRFFRF